MTSFSSNAIFAEVYEELKLLAKSKMRNEAVYSTLQGTALVNEAYLRLGADKQPQWRNRAHFFGAAAEAMRRILIDRARKRRASKHGGDLKRASEDTLNALPEQFDVDEQLLALNDALEKFGQVEPRKAELVKLKFFFGMTYEEVADALEISVPTAKRWWPYASAWLKAEISALKR